MSDLSFEISQGDVVGIIGRNGAGKSTLLRILSRITEPSVGRVVIHGRVASLLEVGTGFHPELSGRENIFLNGAILGMRRSEVSRKFDEIVDFAGVEQFLDTPVKRFSSGMYTRLAFAVAAFLESDILIVDEVLAVGDASFQQKCLGRMEDVSASGRTVLFVSHNIGSLLAVCHSGILLNGGHLEAQGGIREVAKAYQALGGTDPKLASNAFSGTISDVRFDTIELNRSPVSGQVFARQDEPLEFRFRGTCSAVVPRFSTAFSLLKDGVRLFTAREKEQKLEEGEFSASVTLPAGLLRPGDYQIALGGRSLALEDWLWGIDLATVTIIGEQHAQQDGLINLPAPLMRQAREHGQSLMRASTG